MNIRTGAFYKVIVLTVDVFESNITAEKNFASKEDASRYIQYLPAGQIGVCVEM